MDLTSTVRAGQRRSRCLSGATWWGALALGSYLPIAPPTRIDVAHHNSVTSHVTDCNILAGNPGDGVGDERVTAAPTASWTGSAVPDLAGAAHGASPTPVSGAENPHLGDTDGDAAAMVSVI